MITFNIRIPIKLKLLVFFFKKKGIFKITLKFKVLNRVYIFNSRFVDAVKNKGITNKYKGRDLLFKLIITMKNTLY